MEHEQAIRSRAAEKYVARALSPEEKDAFEEHYFGCPDCAEDVRFELALTANLRAVLGQPLPEHRPPPNAGVWARLQGWLHAHPALALSYGGNATLAAALAVFLLTGGRDPIRPQFAQIYFAPGPKKGVEDVRSLAPGDTHYVVNFPVAHQTEVYRYQVLDESGGCMSTGAVPAPASSAETVYLPIPVGRLSAHVYTLEVYAGKISGEMVSRSRFQLSR